MISLTHVQTPEELSALATSAATRGLRADRAVLFLLDEARETLSVPGREGELPLDAAGFAGWCALHREAAVVPDAQVDPRREPLVDGSARSVVATPVVAEGRLRGALTAAREADPAPFDESDAGRLDEVAQAVGGALVTLDVRADLESFMLHAQEWLVMGVERLAPGGDGHVWRVSALARLLSEALGFAPPQVERIWTAARYHDLGWMLAGGRKIWEAERYHPLVGASALRPVRMLGDLADLVEMHHERWDGSGFPGGLVGDAIPLEACALILAEDLDEQLGRERAENAARPRPAPWRLTDALTRFLERQREAHHPRAVQALERLAAGDRLQSLYS